MPFNLDEWTVQVKQRLQTWALAPRQALSDAGAQTLFGFLATMTLFPLAEALAKGDSLGVGLTLGSIAAGVGGNLVAEQVQRWQARADGKESLRSQPPSRGRRPGDGAPSGYAFLYNEKESVMDLEAELAASQELRQALDAILDELDVIHQAHQTLPPTEQEWLLAQLQSDLTVYPGLERTAATVGDIYNKIVVKGGTVGVIGGRQHTVKFVEHEEHHYYPAPLPDSPISRSLPPDPRAAFRAYLTHTIDQTQCLRLQGIRSAGELVSIDLEEIYITLDAVQKRVVQADDLEAELARLGKRLPGDKAWSAEALREREVEVVLSVNEALAEHPRLVVLGAPGSGKTTFLHYLALTFARDLRDRPGLIAERLGLKEEAERRLPVLLPLRDFARHLATTQEDAGLDGPRFLLDYLAAYFAAQEIGLPQGFFRKALAAGGAAVLLDGLDEVADPDLRRRVARIVEAFTRRYPANRFVVASRLVGYQGAARLGEGFFCATVRDFDRAAVARFVGNWSLAVETALAGRRSPTIERRAAKQAKSLLAAITGNERVRELAVNPLLLTVIALVHRYRAKLPERRAELYEECIEVLLGYWDEARGVKGYALPGLDLDAGDKRSLLEPVAFWMQERQLREVDREMLHKQLRDLFLPLSDGDRRLAGKRAENFVGIINARSGLLQERGLGVYSFSHLTFQEYLAARALAGREDFIAYALDRTADGWWREVLLLAAGYLSTQGKERVTAYIRALMETESGADPYHNLVLAADCLRDVGRARVAGDLWGEVTARLLGDMSDETIPVARRVAAGEALGRVGDPRFSVTGVAGEFLEPELIPIPAGEFWLGSETKAAWDDEKPAHKLYLPAFQIARFPATNAQYQCFVDTGGYQERRYWTAAGWAWRHGDFGEKPQGYEDDWWDYITGRKNFDFPEGWEEGRHSPEKANHPVVGVTWFEALAYCRWLAEVTTKAYRLPSEAEWEKAARGGIQIPMTNDQMGAIRNPNSKREYPWGDAFDPAKANLKIGDEPVGGASPVGVYPGGASPYGVEELSGNVWEWTQSRWGQEWSKTPGFGYPYDPKDGREDEEAEGLRVLRGGSWALSDERNARCSCRYYDPPAYFYDNFGFRVVVRSPSPPANF